MSRFVRWLAVVLALASVSCFHPIEGPPPPDAARVAAVRVEAVPPEPPTARTIEEPSRVRSIARSGVLSSYGWEEARGRELLPLYRIDLVDEDGAAAIYWLGTNSYPAEFPCFRQCTGWWIAPSDTSGALDASRYKGLTSAAYVTFLRDLGLF